MVKVMELSLFTTSVLKDLRCSGCLWCKTEKKVRACSGGSSSSSFQFGCWARLESSCSKGEVKAVFSRGLCGLLSYMPRIRYGA